MAVSLVAVVLSQLPPIHLLIRPRRLEVEVHSRVQLTHRVGNPNMGLVVGITNSGGRNLKVRSMRLAVTRDGQALVDLPAQAYYETPSSASSVLLVPFDLKPGESWAHAVTFLNSFDRQTEKLYRESYSRLKADLRKKLEGRAEGDRELVTLEPVLVAPFLSLFERLFLWEIGEYVISLSVTVTPGSASYSKKYRFTLYEADTRELRQQAENYKYGAGIAYEETDTVVMIPINEHID